MSNYTHTNSTGTNTNVHKHDNSGYAVVIGFLIFFAIADYRMTLRAIGCILTAPFECLKSLIDNLKKVCRCNKPSVKNTNTGHAVSSNPINIV